MLLLFIVAGATAQENAIETISDESRVAEPLDPMPAAERSVLAESMLSAAEPAADFCRCVVGTHSPIVTKMEKALGSPLRSAGLGFSDAPLQQVARVIEEEYGFPVRLDVPALDEIGISPEEPVTFSMSDISLRSALRLMLKHLQLTYIIRDEVLLITTPEAADQELIICVYDVREIVGTAKDQSVDQLIDAIVSCVSTDTWAENGGGEAEVRWIKPGFLVVSQTQAVHEEIRALLATIRDVRAHRSVDGPDPADSAAADANRVNTQYYALEMSDAASSGAVRQQIYSLITDSLPDERWNGKLGDGQSVVLSILPDRVVLRHKPAVQEKVQALLTDSGLSAPSATAKGRGGRGGQAGGSGFFQPQLPENNRP
jgi:hypothetical protein